LKKITERHLQPGAGGPGNRFTVRGRERGGGGWEKKGRGGEGRRRVVHRFVCCPREEESAELGGQA